MNQQFLKGKTALVTGSTSGIGLGMAKAMAKAGAQIVINGFGDHKQALQEIAAFDVKVLFHPADMRKPSEIEDMMQQAVNEFGRVDILINNAGIGSLTTVEHESDEVWQRVLNINVIGTARVSKLAIPLLRNSKHAAIVNTASIAATDGLPNRAAYSASKGAVLTLTLAMATDHLPDGIRVNAVNPATTDTPWIKKLLDLSDDANAARVALEARQPMGKLISPAEIANAILFLASPLQASITGTTLSIDGGMHSLRIAKK